MLGRCRNILREQYLWWLLPLFFVIAFVLENRTGVVNFFRVVVFLLVIFTLRLDDFKFIWRNKPCRLFLLFICWQSLTLLWDGLSETDWKLFQRIFQVMTLLMLVSFCCRYHADRSQSIFYTYIIFGFIGLIFIFSVWPGSPGSLALQFPDIDRRYFYTRGVFTISIYVGWMMAVLAIAAFLAAYSHKIWFRILFFLASFCFILLVIYTQSRAAWAVMVVGLFLVTLLKNRGHLVWWFAAMVFVLIGSLILIPETRILLAFNIDRGNSFRYAIWLHGLEQLLSSPQHLILGFGLSASTLHTVGGEAQNHFHSLYLNTLYYSGLVGLSLYLSCLYQLFKTCITNVNRWWLLCLILPMQIGFFVDGEHFFVVPSAMMLAYLLPLFWAMFDFQPFPVTDDENGLTSG